MRHGRRMPGYSMVFWAVFIALILLPLLSLAIEVGRYSYARAEIAKAADAAALAAAIEIDRSVFRESGNLVATSQAWGQAQAYANSNVQYLSSYGIRAVVTSVRVDNASHAVRVVVTADLEALFPSALLVTPVSETGVAIIRAETFE